MNEITGAAPGSGRTPLPENPTMTLLIQLIGWAIGSALYWKALQWALDDAKGGA